MYPAMIAIDTVRIDKNDNHIPRMSCGRQGPDLQRRGITVPETENRPQLQMKSAPEVLEQYINTMKCTWNTADIKGTRKSMKLRASALGSWSSC
jgi:hypothetical protein